VFSEVIKKGFQKVDEVIQLARFNKNSKERESKRDSRHNKFLYWFTQQPDYVQSLTHNKDFTKTDQPDHVHNTCLQQENTAYRNATAEPTADQETTQKELPCWNPQQVTVIQSPLYNPETFHYNPHCCTHSRTRNHIYRNVSQPIQNPLYKTELPTQITHSRITFNTVKELSQFKQYKHFYTTNYKNNKERA